MKLAILKPYKVGGCEITAADLEAIAANFDPKGTPVYVRLESGRAVGLVVDVCGGELTCDVAPISGTAKAEIESRAAIAAEVYDDGPRLRGVRIPALTPEPATAFREIVHFRFVALEPQVEVQLVMDEQKVADAVADIIRARLSPPADEPIIR